MYRIGAFARFAGVTAKTLYHYERHGLLGPARTAAGYRRYTRRDLIRLQRILALKSLGLSLKQIALIQGDGTRLPAVCAGQRRALDEKRQRIDQALRALEAIERDGDPAKALDRFVGEATWTRAEAQRAAMAAPVGRAPDRVSPSKLELFRDIEAALDQDPGSDTARRLRGRWDAMVERETGGDPDAIAAIRKAWANWRNLPDGVRRYSASLYATEPAALERVVSFIERCRTPHGPTAS